jgi:hypothetical protein
MELDETYKYLDIEEGDSIANSQMKSKVVKEYYLQFWQISQDRVKLKAQDHSYQHLSCTSPSLQLWNSQLANRNYFGNVD